MEMADHESPIVRDAAGNAISLVLAQNKEISGGMDKLLKLMASDSDPTVRKNIAAAVGKFENEAFLPIYEKTLFNPDEADLHSSFTMGLVSMWFDYPGFKTASEKAYQMTLAYLKLKPRTKNIPAWQAVSALKSASGSNFETWKKRATWYNPQDVAAALVEVALDSNAGTLARNYAVEALVTHGYTKAQLEKLLKDAQALADSDKDKKSVISEIEKAISK
jgi:hypothetical protein